MRSRVSLVVVPIDDFTDNIIEDKYIKVAIEGYCMKKPIKKQEGQFVFTDINENNVVIQVEAYSYTIVKLQIDISNLNPLNPVIKVRLRPNFQYKFDKSVTYITGETTPNSRIKIVHPCIKNTFRILEDNIKSTSYLKIYNPLNIDLEGKIFIIKERNSKVKEEFAIIEFDEENNTYILNKKLNRSYDKEACEIIKLDYINVFEDGRFFFPLKNVTEDQNKILIELENLKKKILELKAYSINKLELF